MAPLAYTQTYCSEACRDADRSAHGLLCVGPCDAGDPLVEFKMHAVATSGEAFLLVAKAIVAVCVCVCLSFCL